MINTFPDFDVYEIKLNKTDEKFLVPDEDAIEKAAKESISWENSLDIMGTVAFTHDIERRK